MPKQMRHGKAYEEVSIMLDACNLALQKLVPEKMGLEYKKIFPIVDSLERMRLALQKHYEDLKHIRM